MLSPPVRYGGFMATTRSDNVKVPALPLPGVSLLDRYIFLELAFPFLFGVAAFTSLVMAIGSLFELVRLMVENGLSVETAFKIFVLRLPGFVVLTFPMSMLLSTLLAFSRLSTGSEIIALKACGVSVYRMLVPAIIMSVAVTGLTFYFNEQLVPQATYEATITLAKALGNDVPAFKKNNIYYQEYGERKNIDGSTSRQLIRILYARNYNEGVMENMIVLDFSREQFNQIMTAQRGTWQPKENGWLFEDGVIYTIGADSKYRNILQFYKQKVNISQRPLELVERSKRRPEEMTITQLGEFIKLSADAGQETTSLWVNYYQKFSLPFACIAFALVGSALGLRPQRSVGTSLGLGMSILIIFAYYVFSFLTNAWGQLGYITPILAAWLPGLVTAGVGGLLIVRVAR
jgi:lipopolysaccharide export system permease protein